MNHPAVLGLALFVLFLAFAFAGWAAWATRSSARGRVSTSRLLRAPAAPASAAVGTAEHPLLTGMRMVQTQADQAAADQLIRTAVEQLVPASLARLQETFGPKAAPPPAA